MDFTKDPVLIAEYIRFWLGNLGTNAITDETILRIINLTLSRLDDSATGCDATYYATIDVLKWLIREGEKGSAGDSTAGSGALKKYTEKVGDTSVSKEYDVGVSVSNATASGWDRVLEDLLASPDSIGCSITRSETQAGSGGVVIGGVSQAEYDRVNSDPDSKNGFKMTSPYRSHLTIDKNLIG